MQNNRWRHVTDDDYEDASENDDFTADDIKELDDIFGKLTIIKELGDSLKNIQKKLDELLMQTYTYHSQQETNQSISKTTQPLT